MIKENLNNKTFFEITIEYLINLERDLLNIKVDEEISYSLDKIKKQLADVKMLSISFNFQDVANTMKYMEKVLNSLNSHDLWEKPTLDFFINSVKSIQANLNNEKVDINISSKHVFSNTMPITDKNFKLDDKKILVVDDEEGICELLDEMITDIGYNVVTYTSGLKLLESIRKESPQVVISDIKMPEIDGLELLAEIRKIHRDLPVVFVSGYITPEVCIQALEYNVYGFLTKPFNQTQILNLLKNACDKYYTAALLRQSTNFIMNNFIEIENAFIAQGKYQLLEEVKKEFQEIQIKKMRLFKNKAS